MHHQFFAKMRAWLGKVGTATGMELLTMNQLCEALKISRSTLYRIRLNGAGFPAGVRVGQRYRWYLSEVQAYLERNRECFSDYGYMVSERFANPRKPYARLRAVS